MMVRRNLCGLLVLSLVLSVAFATENKEKAEESDKKDLSENKDEKTVSKRGILHHYSSHGHVHPAVVSYSHHHIPNPIVAKIPTYAKIPVLARVPVVVHKPLIPQPAVHVAPAALPVAPSPLPFHFAPPALPVPFGPAPVPFAPAPAPLPVPVAPPQPHYSIVPGGASVTSYSVNYPRALLPQPVVPAVARPVVPVAPHFHPHYHPAPAVSHYHPHFFAKPAYAPRPVIPVAVPVHGIRYPKIPIYFNQPKPVYPQFAPSPQPTPSFVPVAVPANSQPAAPQNPGIEDSTVPSIAQNTNMNMVITQQHFPQIPVPLQPTQPTFIQQPGNSVQQNPQPGTVFQQQPGGVFQQQPGGVFQQQPGGVFQQQPGGVFQQQPGGVLQQQPGGVFQQQPGGVFQQDPGSVFEQTPQQPSASNQPGSVTAAFFPQQPGVTQQQPSFIQPTLTVSPQPTRPTHVDRPLIMPQSPPLNMPIAPARPSLHIPPMTSHGMRPIMMMTPHRPQPTQPTFTNKAPYNYHAPAVPFNHQTSSTNNVVSGHGQMASQLMHQLALYQQQQQNQQYIQQQENSFPYPAAAETFHQSYDPPSNNGQYHGLSSYQVPIHH